MEQFPDVKPHGKVRADFFHVCLCKPQSTQLHCEQITTCGVVLYTCVFWLDTDAGVLRNSVWHMQAEDLSDPPDVTRLDDVEQQQEQQEPAPV